MPPLPPPLICLPFFGGKKNRPRLTYSEHSATEDYSSRRSSIDRLGSDNSYSFTATLTSRAEKPTFSSETETFDVNGYNDAARDVTPAFPVIHCTPSHRPSRKSTSVCSSSAILSTDASSSSVLGWDEWPRFAKD